MLRQRKLRDRLVAMAAPPLVISAAVAIGALVQSDSGDGRSIALAALAATVALGAWSYLIGWTLIRSLNSLAIASTGLAEAQARIASGELDATELPSIGHAGPADEIGRVAESVDAISRSAFEVAETQRESIRKGLATIVINLARRNQSLLDRQVEYLDALEQSEEDPDRLAELFRVDHLATRMRRNAESLLVLAGADTAKRKGAPVAMSDVLRVAIGEVESYQHIELGIVEDGEVPAGVAVDLAHLSAELMENATQFSPPSTTVEVSAVVDRTNQCFTIKVVDRGMGLGDRLDLANETLANPPELGLGMGRSLGFMVVGRLAKRLGAVVRLQANEGGGTVAEVMVPLSRFRLDDEPLAEQPEPVEAPAGPPVAATAATQAAPAAPPAPAPVPAPAPRPAPATQPAVRQPDATAETVASTTLEKLLGINTSSPTPGPAAALQASPPAEPDARPAGEADRVPEALAGQPPVPPPAEDPTWGSLGDDQAPQQTAPTADEPAWEPPPLAPTASSEPSAPSAPSADEAIWDQLSTDQTPTPFGDPFDQPGPPTDQPVWESPPPSPSQPADAEPTWEPPPLDPAPAIVEPSWPPPSEPTRSPDPDIDRGWTPPPVTPAPIAGDPPMPPPPSRLEEAVPSGEAFESGVASLLDQPDQGATGWPDTSQRDEEPAALQKRQRGASNVPIGQGRPVAAPTRSPEQVRAMLSRYREGLKGGAKKAADSGPPRDHAEDKDGER